MSRAQARAIAHLAILRARATGISLPRKPRRVPKMSHPYALEARLYALLRDAVRGLYRDIDTALVAYAPLRDTIQAERPAGSRHDAERFDRLAHELERLFAPLLARWGQQARSLKPALAKLVRDVSARNYLQVQTQVKTVIGVDVLMAEPWLNDELAAATREVAGLVVDIGETAITRVERLVSDGVRTGASTKTIKDELKAELGICERRAALIAVDQVGKLNGNLARLRQTALGVESYDWMTVGDNRVRQAHRPRQGQRFKWSDPPPDGHPGQPVRCRCTGSPVLDMFDDLLGPSPQYDWNAIDG
jgi:SPP1 gp7 family putative phage head morphogenesis protein